jgi:uncharacterized protein YbjT (DUF2867 family)
MRIAVAGGSGTVGREVVAAARHRGHETVVIARSTGVDLRDGTGLEDALRGVDAVVDAVSIGTLSETASTEFFRAASGALLAAAADAGVSHAVLLSVVGVDRNPHGYYAGKVAQEELYERGPVPWTIVRATQFHEFAQQTAARARFGPIQLAPHARTQPIAAAEVGEHLVTLAETGPQGRTADIAGPREEDLSDMIRAWVRRQGRRGPVIPVRLPGAQMRGMRQGLALPGADARLLGPTFAEWLAADAHNSGRTGSGS